MDRTYLRWSWSWHAFRDYVEHGATMWYRAACGRVSESFAEDADRVPAAGHLCGSCSRSIAARTDIEERTEDVSDYGQVAPI